MNARLPLLLVLLLALMPAAWAAIDVYEFKEPEQEQRFRNLIDELRCPKCQNQNISGSDAPLAKDLRQKTYDMMQAGKSNGEIVDYLVERYGDFVTYRPPLRPDTLLLWFGPFAFMIVVALLLRAWIKRRAREPAPTALDPRERERLDALLNRYGEEPK